MLINLIPEFLEIIASPNPAAAYRAFADAHRSLLTAYWRNYLLEPDSAPADGVVDAALRADRSDLRALLATVDVAAIAEEALALGHDALRVDRPVDCYLMVGMGGANAGELVLGGRGAIFLCIEHFTGRANPETYGMGLAPELLGLWTGHELAHIVRYTAPDSASDLRRIVSDQGGYYDYWETGSRAPLRELLLNEGLAVHAAEAVAPGFRPNDYFGYARRQYHRLREMEAFLRRAAEPDLDRAGLGLRLRWLSGGMSPAARHVMGRVVPERSGYYLGYRMAEPLVAQRGIAEALRAAPEEFQALEDAAAGMRSA